MRTWKTCKKDNWEEESHHSSEYNNCYYKHNQAWNTDWNCEGIKQTNTLMNTTIDESSYDQCVIVIRYTLKRSERESSSFSMYPINYRRIPVQKVARELE